MFRRSRCLAMFASAVALSSASYGGLFEDLYYGLDILSTPGGGPLLTNGAGFQINGNRQGRLRIVPNAAGGGHRIEFDRNFGLDGAGRAEILDFGNLELELIGPISFTGSYTTRGLPTANGQLTINNLAYNIRGKTGAQDIDLAGLVSADGQLEINPLGFYTARVDVQNTVSDLALDGVAIEVDRDTDFNVGPISIRGNIYVDLITSALSSFGVDTSAIEGAFPGSPFDRINAEIRDSIVAEAAVLGITSEAPALDSPTATFKGLMDRPALASSTQVTSPIPEPGGLALLSCGAALVAGRRRR